ncbi:restriction endonuclease [Pseudenhygromyxa sp. WMMC2535]|uniref:restriction endonuclease n=1 Tax=Pseudenhygromyxa sp. WMMC2535 TaxID=2712867 RepID=UPI00159620E4|nr:restriction endonuclease [Pseudenhygromyxa sp. WMMC2535]NVB42237.1 restriction endonuclease [Pseudenhygromyxa sp. WMMC2535]
MAVAIRDGISHPDTMQEFLGVDPRHFNYYRQASEILGLVEEGDSRALVLTGLGDRLLATGEGSLEERAVFREAISGATSLRPFRSFFEGEVVGVQQLAGRLQSLTGMAQSTAERRARTLVQWRRYVEFEGGDESEAGPRLPDLGDQLERIVAHHNAVAKQRMLDWLATLNPSRFESLAADLLIAMGYVGVEIVGGSGDGGVDIVADQIDRWGHRVSVAVQAKRWTRVLGRRVIDEMLGVLVRQRIGHCILITVSSFSVAAREAAAADPRLRLVDGAQLVELMAANGVVVRLGRHGEIVPKDEGMGVHARVRHEPCSPSS